MSWQLESTERTLPQQQHLQRRYGATKSASKSASIGKRLAKRNPTKKIVKKPIGIKLKAKAKKQLKVNPVSKALLQNTKTAENRKKLLRNGVKEIKPTKKRKQGNEK
ncbi:hypothetical protein JTB14_011773 [Gonioctena quinquepunctata]|nr:hypothetical protein JTB14_011773 [Gonioctena quinquepunctata]